MEKFYIVKDEKLINDYKEWEIDDLKIQEAFVQLKKEFEIESNEYYANSERLVFKLKDSDYKKFKKDLMANSTERFKIKSPQNKRWLELMKEKGIKGLRKPFIKDYLHTGCIGGKMWSNLFEIESVLYGYFETEFEKKISPPEGFIEIKASQYYKIIEDYEEKMNISN